MFEEMMERIESGVLDRVDRYLNQRQEQPPRQLNLISQTALRDELDISYQTIKRWEKAGLRRYQPPIEDTRSVYYKITDVLKFFGVENG